MEKRRKERRPLCETTAKNLALQVQGFFGSDDAVFDTCVLLLHYFIYNENKMVRVGFAFSTRFCIIFYGTFLFGSELRVRERY